MLHNRKRDEPGRPVRLGIPVLQQDPQAHESNLLGQERILARTEETREINMAMAEHRGGRQGNQAGAA